MGVCLTISREMGKLSRSRDGVEVAAFAAFVRWFVGQANAWSKLRSQNGLTSTGASNTPILVNTSATS